MPRTPVVDKRKVKLTPVTRGVHIALLTAEGSASVPAPDRGIYFETPSCTYFVSARELWDALDKLIDQE